LSAAAIAAADNQTRMLNQRLQLEFFNSWWWMVCRPKHVEQLRNIGIIKSTTRLRLAGSFYEFYITMHGSINIKPKHVASPSLHDLNTVTLQKSGAGSGCGTFKSIFVRKD